MKILLLTTGGTIGGESAEREPGEKVAIGAKSFTGSIGRTLGALESEIGEDIHVDAQEVCQVDSSNILPSHWMDLVSRIDEHYATYDAFVITHGTNTLGYTSAALSFAILNPGKPIVMTGSQVPFDQPGSDAIINLENAFRVALYEYGQWERTVSGVTVVFGGKIMAGTRVKKDTEFDYNAFKSFGIGSLGHIAGRVNIDEAMLDKHRSYFTVPPDYRPDRTGNKIKVLNDFCMDIASLTEFPGMSPDLFRSLHQELGIKGFILRAFGAGDPALEVHRETFQYLRDQHVPLVITTQAPNGTSTFQVNQPGQEIELRELAIPAWDMSIESQTTKLAWLLAKYPRGDQRAYDTICAEMRKNLRGEIGPAWRSFE